MQKEKPASGNSLAESDAGFDDRGNIQKMRAHRFREAYPMD